MAKREKLKTMPRVELMAALRALANAGAGYALRAEDRDVLERSAMELENLGHSIDFARAAARAILGEH
ncbi:hypothetical protein [Salipiger mangrovisoli]|uniref:Uncharacterized protein n=1 Tax=Salipiger mangrovisoli TaxID=2865933 RepID=A0ABR9XBD2_9RHOB|nr:hypothetical protein [Salipiger mangrovisoli]MBE9640918.1 hypothetical protein [Salipiger mangrovisoli]